MAGDAKAVAAALELAENASTKAEAARDAATVNIDLAQERINDVSF